MGLYKNKIAVAVFALVGILGAMPFFAYADTEVSIGVSQEASAFITIPEGISVEHFDTLGKSAKTFLEEVDAFVEKSSQKALHVDVNGRTSHTSFTALGYTIGNRKEIEETIREYTSGSVISRYIKSVELELDPIEIVPEVVFEADTLDTFIEESARDLVASASDATIQRVDGAFVITPSVDGVSVDSEGLKDLLVDALFSTDTDIDIIAPTTIEKARVTTEDVESVGDVLATFTTDYSSSGSARSTNLRVGAEKMNGILLMPGETISGYECMAPFTVANGYEVAKAYENGLVVDSVGGGACQIATTLYNAALLAELEITQRQNHSMTVSYVQASADAAIAGTYKDIKVTNNTDYPVYVEAYTANKKITFTLWGRETRAQNRSVEYVSEILSSTPMGVTYIDDATLEQGVEIKESDGHNGRVSKLWKVVKIDGTEVERTLVSSDTYRMSNVIYRRGTAVPVAEEVVPENTQESTSDQPVEEVIVTGENGGPGA